MIQVYRQTNENYTANGDAVLFPLTCTPSAELNGAWVLELTAPLDDLGRWKLLEVGAVLKAPSFNGNQLFRIRQTEKKDSGVTVTAEPIFLDSVGDCFLLDVRPTNADGQSALNSILSPNSKYSGSSNITTRTTAYFIRKNAMEAIAGSEDVSFLSRWGGEILYNNFEIIINERVGSDNGVMLLYGKNIPVDGVTESVNMDEVVTRIVPVAYNGRTLSGSTPWVDSPIIGSYPVVYTKVITYENIRLKSDIEGEAEEGVIVCNTMAELYAALESAANEEFQNGIDKPQVTIEADLVLLANTEEYKDFKNLESVSLGDTVHLKHRVLGIEQTARVVGLVYDSLQKAVVSVTIGDFIPSFMDRVASSVNATERAITKAGDVKAEKIKGIINGMKSQLRLQSTLAERQDAIAILFEDLDPDSPTYGASAYGSQGWQISSTRNPEDTEWIWTTAATSKGIYADSIVAGTLSAVDIDGVNITGSTITGNTISGGTVTGATINNGSGTFKVDANGDLTATSATIKGAIQSGSTITGSAISGGTVTGTTINNGNGTFKVDANGDLTATSATITGTISGSTITGSTFQTSAVASTPYWYYTQINGGVVKSYIRNGSATGTIVKTTELNGYGVQVYVDTTTEATLTHDYLRIMNSTSNCNLRPSMLSHVVNNNVVYQSTYASGDVVTYGFAVFAGHVTNSTKSIDFFIPLNGSAQGRTATVAIPSNCSVRTPLGYIDSTQYLSASGKTVTATCVRNGIYVRITKSAAFTNVSNNNVVSVAGSFVITFTG